MEKSGLKWYFEVLTSSPVQSPDIFAVGILSVEPCGERRYKMFSGTNRGHDPQCRASGCFITPLCNEQPQGLQHTKSVEVIMLCRVLPVVS